MEGWDLIVRFNPVILLTRGEGWDLIVRFNPVIPLTRGEGWDLNDRGEGWDHLAQSYFWLEGRVRISLSGLTQSYF